MPVGDTTPGGGWWYKSDLETRLHWYGPTGGFFSDVHIGPFLERHYRRVEEIREVVDDPSRSTLEAFAPIRTREQQVPIIDAFTNDVRGEFQINVLNQGALPGVSDDVVTEGPAIIDAGGIHRISVSPLPSKIMIEVIWPSVLGMEWELEAFLTGDRDMWLDGLLMVDTYMGSGRTAAYQQAKDYLEDLLAQPYNAEMAAHFAGKTPDWARVLRRRQTRAPGSITT
jgi:alpha-galactosidase/6-phospho-beta-glucosidase family protein